MKTVSDVNGHPSCPAIPLRRYADMAQYVDNPVDYVTRAHQMGDKLTSAGDFLVFEGMKNRFGGAVLERWFFNKSTSEFAIKVLGGAEAGAMRSIEDPL